MGELTLVDLDDVCVTNTNRQIHALSNTMGQSKVQVMAERIASINPECTLHAEECFLTGNNVETLLDRSLDAVIDAIDAVHPKCLLLAQCHQRQIPVITCGAAGGQCDAGFGSVTHVTAAFGLLAAGDIINRIAGSRNKEGGPGPPSGSGI